MNLIMAERFSQLRKKAGFSQEELAAKLGISRQAVSKWERAESSPDTDNLIALSRLYGISLDELLLGDAYLPVGYYEQYNSSVAQPYNTFIHTMSDEIQQNHSTNTRTINSMLSSEDIFGYFTWQRSVGINSLETAVGTENECWKKTYKYINTTNMVLDELGNVTARNKREEADKIRIEGESHFLRALYYFTLVNLYAAPYEPEKRQQRRAYR